MANTPSYASTPKLDPVQISVANTNRDGTGTLGTVATGTASGKRINRVSINAAGTTTAGAVRFFLSADGGTTKRLFKEVLVPAITPSTSVETFHAEVAELVGLVLPDANAILYAATHNAETFNVFAESGAI